MNNALNFSFSNAVQIIHVRCGTNYPLAMRYKLSTCDAVQIIHLLCGTNYPHVMRQNYPLEARDFVCPRVTRVLVWPRVTSALICPRVTRVLVCPRVTSALICPQSEQENQAGDVKPELTEEEIAGTLYFKWLNKN